MCSAGEMQPDTLVSAGNDWMAASEVFEIKTGGGGGGGGGGGKGGEGGEGGEGGGGGWQGGDDEGGAGGGEDVDGWYAVNDDGDTIGPFTENAFDDLVRSRKVRSRTLVYRGGGDWQTARAAGIETATPRAPKSGGGCGFGPLTQGAEVAAAGSSRLGSSPSESTISATAHIATHTAHTTPGLLHSSSSLGSSSDPPSVPPRRASKGYGRGDSLLEEKSASKLSSKSSKPSKVRVSPSLFRRFLRFKV